MCNPNNFKKTALSRSFTLRFRTPMRTSRPRGFQKKMKAAVLHQIFPLVLNLPISLIKNMSRLKRNIPISISSRTFSISLIQIIKMHSNQSKKDQLVRLSRMKLGIQTIICLLSLFVIIPPNLKSGIYS